MFNAITFQIKKWIWLLFEVFLILFARKKSSDLLTRKCESKFCHLETSSSIYNLFEI